MSQVSSAVCPWTIGVSASWVDRILSAPLPSLTSHPQPLAKWLTDSLVNAVLNASKLPNEASIALATAPVGAPPAPGARQFQKKLWFQCWAELLNTPRLPSACAFLIVSTS